LKVYQAFISYSHAADGRLAPHLQSALHRFAKRWYKVRALRVFRDKTGLSATPALWPSIETAMAQSRFFVLMASPEAARSVWVQREVAWWLENRSSNSLLIVLTDGELVWSSASAEFDWDRTTCLPGNLKDRFSQEPLYVDLRWAKTEANISLRNARFRAAVLDVAAPLHGRSKDELDGDDIREHRRFISVAWVGAIILLISAIVSIWSARDATRSAELAQKRQLEAEQARTAADQARGLEAVARRQADAQRAEAERQARVAEEQKSEAVRQSEISLGRQLAAQSALLRTEQASLLERSALLAIESMRRLQFSLEADQVLRQTLDLLPRKGWKLVHSGAVRSISFSPDGTRVVTGSEDGIIRLWDSATTRVLAMCSHDGPVADARFSPDGKNIAFAGRSGDVRIWDAELVHQVGQFQAGPDVRRLAFSPRGNRLATGEGDGSARIWEVPSGLEMIRVKHADVDVTQLVFSRDGRYLATAGGQHQERNGNTTSVWNDETIRIWDASDGRSIAEFTHKGGARAASFSPDGKLVATAGSDNSARIWSLPSGQLIRALAHTGAVYASVFSPDGLSLATAGSDRLTHIWSVATGRETTRLSDPNEVHLLEFSNDGRYLAGGSASGTLRVWDASTGREVLRIPGRYGTASLAFSKDGRYFAAATWGPVAGVWPVVEAAEIRLAHDGPVESVAFSPDGRLAATASDDSTARIWSATDGRQIGIIHHEKPVHVVAFSPDGARLVSAGEDGLVRIHDSRGERELARLPAEQSIQNLAVAANTLAVSTLTEVQIWNAQSKAEIGRIRERFVGVQIALSPNGERLATISAEAVRLWEAPSGREIARLGRGGEALTFSADGLTLATGNFDIRPSGEVIGNDSLQLWDVRSGKERLRVKVPAKIRAAAFSPDGRQVAVFTEDRVARVFESASGRLGASMRHDTFSYLLAFSPDGKHLVTASERTAYVWEAATGRKVAEVQHDARIRWVGFSPDGRFLATASDDGTARLWLWRPDDLVHELCQRLARNLSPQEWRDYLGGKAYRKTCEDLH
jgi:WD40 repeat protein